MVSDSIVVHTRPAQGGGAHVWTGLPDGTYTLEPLEECPVGTAVILTAKPGRQIGCTGGHYNIQVIPFKELLNGIKDKQVFLLLLPLAVINTQDKNQAAQIISNVLQEIFDKHLCSQYASCIVTGLMSE